MNQTTRLEWGLLPVPEGEYIAVWGARAILERGEISLLPDRQQMTGGNGARELLRDWINDAGLPELKRHIKANHWNGSTDDVFTLEKNVFKLIASPKASHGYLYITVTMEGQETIPDGKWSGDYVPQIGETVHAKINGLGKCKVLGYLEYGGWNAIIAQPLNPPEWFVKQNGKVAACSLFGAEFERCDHDRNADPRRNRAFEQYALSKIPTEKTYSCNACGLDAESEYTDVHAAAETARLCTHELLSFRSATR